MGTKMPSFLFFHFAYQKTCHFWKPSVVITPLGVAEPPGQLQDPASWNSPKLLRRLLGKLPGNSGCWGNCCGDCRQDCPFSEEQRNGSHRSSSRSTPSFPGSFPSSLRGSFGEFQLGGPVAGRGRRNPKGFCWNRRNPKGDGRKGTGQKMS